MSHRSQVGKVKTRLLTLLTVLLIATPAFTQGLSQESSEDAPEGAETKSTPDPAQERSPVSVSAKIDQSQLKPGHTAKLEPGWHLYALTQPKPPRAAQVTIEENGVFKSHGPVQQPKPKVYKDPNFSMPGEPPFMSQAFENEVTFTAPVIVTDDAKEGAQKLIVKFSYQACDDKTCLRPTTKTFEIDTMIAGAPVKTNSTATQAKPEATQASFKPPATTETPAPSPTAAPETATTTPSSGGTPQVIANKSEGPAPPNQTTAGGDSNEYQAKDLKSRGLFGFIWFALIQGLLALLTPCVFPMIPITVSFFTKRDQKSGGAAVGQAAFFAAGIIFTYTV